MRFTEIGQQLRAFRMESGLRAEEIAARLGVSRAALYRYEKGEVIKLDTVQRLAELLKISPLSLLGIGIEYYGRPAAFFERLRQIEETAEQILIVNEPLAYLTTSASYDRALADALLETVEADPERFGPRSAIDQILSQKRKYDKQKGKKKT
jgi:transcriptional regulator with XRE-family HTH domain